MNAVLMEGEIVREDRTGGFTQPGSGFEKVREELASQRTLSGTIVSGLAVVQGAARALGVNELAQVLVRTIDCVLLPNDVRRFVLYDSIALALLQRIQSQTDYSISQKEEEFYYEGPEPDKRVRAVLNLLRSMPIRSQESSTAYMDETDAT